MHKIIVCLSCDGEFTIKHSMDDIQYRVQYCPFCGEMIDDDETYHFDDEEEE
jgi:predicted RNA-binding Zn-ribbon protein involved in translation (DUF1610 family)